MSLLWFASGFAAAIVVGVSILVLYGGYQVAAADDARYGIRRSSWRLWALWHYTWPRPKGKTTAEMMREEYARRRKALKPDA